MSKDRKKIGEILLELGFITPRQLEEAINLTKEKHIRTGEALFQMGALDHDRLYWVLGNQMNMNYLQLIPEMIDNEFLSKFPLDKLEDLECLPLYEMGEEIHLAIADPAKTDRLEELHEFTKGKTFSLHLALPKIIKSILEYYRKENLLKKRIVADKPKSSSSIQVPKFSIVEKDTGFSDILQIMISAPGGTVFKVFQNPSGLSIRKQEDGGFRNILDLPNVNLDLLLDDLKKRGMMDQDYCYPLWYLVKSREGENSALLRCHMLKTFGSALLMIERLPDFSREVFQKRYPSCEKIIKEIGKLYRKKPRFLIGGPDVNYIKQCVYLAMEQMCKDSCKCPALFVENDIVTRFPNVMQTNVKAFHISGISLKFSANPFSFLLYEYNFSVDGSKHCMGESIFDYWNDIIIVDIFHNHKEMEIQLCKRDVVSLEKFGLIYMEPRDFSVLRENN